MKTILITDDDEFLTSMYELSLKKDGVRVVVAHDGEQALAQMEKEKPDLMLLDLLMPKMDGFSVLQHMKEKNIHVPVVILSNLKGEMDQKRCKELGAKDYYCKSDMDLDALTAKVKALL